MDYPDLPLLPVDHSWWAKSVRWSCGHPGAVPLFDWAEQMVRLRLLEYAQARIGATIPRADGDGFLKITSLS